MDVTLYVCREQNRKNNESRIESLNRTAVYIVTTSSTRPEIRIPTSPSGCLLPSCRHPSRLFPCATTFASLLPFSPFLFSPSHPQPHCSFPLNADLLIHQLSLYPRIRRAVACGTYTMRDLPPYIEY